MLKALALKRASSPPKEICPSACKRVAGPLGMRDKPPAPARRHHS